MKRFLFLSILAALILGLAALIACSTSSSSSADDDAVDDDDNDDSSDDDASPSDDDDDSAAGVWTDTTSSLMWELNPNSLKLSLDDAKAYCDGLSLSGFTDWSVPSIDQLRTLVRGCVDVEPSGSCTVTNTCTTQGCVNDPCGGCDGGSGPSPSGEYWPNALDNTGLTDEDYWSSTLVSDDAGNAFTIYFYQAWLEYESTTGAYYVRCVRAVTK